MVSVYKDEDFLAVYKQRKKILNLFWVITAVYAVFCLGWLAFHISLPYKDPLQNLAKGCVFVASALYVVFAFPYLGIKYSRVNRYYKLMTYFSEGLKYEEQNYFYCFEEKSLQKDNVDVISCVFETWNKKKCEWMDREAYFDVEKPTPEFESGDYVRYIVQSNFILQYDIVQKKALEFEEVDEDGEVIEDEVIEDESVEAETEETQQDE